MSNGAEPPRGHPGSHGRMGQQHPRKAPGSNEPPRERPWLTRDWQEAEDDGGCTLHFNLHEQRNAHQMQRQALVHQLYPYCGRAQERSQGQGKSGALRGRLRKSSEDSDTFGFADMLLQCFPTLTSGMTGRGAVGRVRPTTTASTDNAAAITCGEAEETTPPLTAPYPEYDTGHSLLTF